MRQRDEDRASRSGTASDRVLWQRSLTTEVPEDAAARFLDLAAFADGRLDEDDHERVAALLAHDPAAAADVEAARALASLVDDPPEVRERILARAAGLVAAPPQPARVIALNFRRRRVWFDLAQWGSLAAAVALASWLGFAMGSDASLTYSQADQPNAAEDAFPSDLLDPGTGFLRDLGEGIQT
jgi:anti-sigma factor RsiW